MSAVERLLAIDLELDTTRQRRHDLERLDESLRRERSSILMSINFADRQDYEQAVMSRVAAPLDGISAVRAGK